VFKRMALLKPESDVIEGEAAVVSDIADETANIVAPAPEAPATDSAAQSTVEPEKVKKPVQSSGLLGLLQAPKPKRAAKKKAAILENQMSLFDMLDTPA